MGLFSGGNSSSSNTTNNTSNQTSINLDDNDGYAIVGDNNTIEMVDAGLVDFASEQSAQAFEFGNNSVDKAFEFSHAVSKNQNSSFERALNFASMATRPDGGQSEQLTKTIMIGAAVMVGVVSLVAFKQ